MKSPDDGAVVIDFVAYKKVRDEAERGWLEVFLEEIVEKQMFAAKGNDDG
jgi:hypothetical protein